jgi:membrane protease YdiL (CAAX protease family)
MLALGGVVLLVGASIFFYERKKAIPIRPRYFGWMIGESILYAVVVALLVSGTVQLLFAFAPVGTGPQEASDFWVKLALSIGAGLYEELVFRVLLVGGLYWVLKRLFARQRYAYAVAALVGALLFSAVHYTGVLGDVFTLSSFTFRFLFGLVLNVIFLLRGFGIAAWTHALYDVMVVSLGG